MSYQEKYLKYKKYIELKNFQKGGGVGDFLYLMSKIYQLVQ